MDIKHCNTCNKEKIHSEFHIRAASPDGLSAKCKDCAKEYDNARANLPHRVAARAAYRNTENGKISVSKAKKKYDSSEKKLVVVIVMAVSLLVTAYLAIPANQYSISYCIPYGLPSLVLFRMLCAVSLNTSKLLFR